MNRRKERTLPKSTDITDHNNHTSQGANLERIIRALLILLW